MLTRLATYRIAARGKRGYCISVPAAWLRDKGVKEGEPMDVFRNDAGDLVVRPANLEVKE